MSQQTDDSINRRRVLKLTGVAVVGGAATTGVASADPHAPEEVRFCGCSQVCVKRGAENDPFWVITAEDVDGDFEYDCIGPYNTVTCVETEYKIIAIVDGALNVICNPNHCARMVRDRTDGFRVTCPRGEAGGGDFTVYECDCDGVLAPGEHEYVCTGLKTGTPGETTSVTIRTNRCQPPWKWDDDDGNGGRGGPP